MPMKICSTHGLTGVLRCPQCGSKTTPSKGTIPAKLDRLEKRRLDRDIRLRGRIPTIDLRRGL